MRSSSHFPICLRLLAFAALFAATLAPAANNSAEPIFAVVDVDLDASGNILAIEPVDDVAREISDFLRVQVSKWKFEPAKLAGEAVPTRTSVSVRLEATGERNGRQIEVRVVDAATGPRYKVNPAPSYPTAALDRNDSGEVLLRVQFDREGQVTDATVERSVGRKYFEAAALRAVREWTFLPERAGEVGIPATVLVPISFCIRGRPCQSLPEVPGGDAKGPRLIGEPVARIHSRDAAG